MNQRRAQIAKYYEDRLTIPSRYYRLPGTYFTGSDFALSRDNSKKEYVTLYSLLPFRTSKDFLGIVRLELMATIYHTMFPILGEADAGFFSPEINQTHIIHQIMKNKHENVSKMLELLDIDYFQEERNLLEEQKLLYIELLADMANARDKY